MAGFSLGTKIMFIYCKSFAKHDTKRKTIFMYIILIIASVPHSVL